MDEPGGPTTPAECCNAARNPFPALVVEHEQEERHQEHPGAVLGDELQGLGNAGSTIPLGASWFGHAAIVLSRLTAAAGAARVFGSPRPSARPVHEPSGPGFCLCWMLICLCTKRRATPAFWAMLTVVDIELVEVEVLP